MIHLHLFGGVDLRDGDGTRIESLQSQPKRVALLAYLAVANSGAPVRRDTLLAVFWPESDDRRARNNLNQTIHQLRRALGSEVIEVQGEAEVGLASGSIWCDVLAFDAALDRGDLETAVTLRRRPFLDGFHLSGASAFEEWAERERSRFERYTASAIARLVVQAESDPEEAVRWAEQGYALNPADEDALSRLLTSLAAAGRPRVALEQYDAYAGKLREDTGAEPSARVRALAAEILQRPELPTAPPAVVSSDSESSMEGRSPDRQQTGRRYGIRFMRHRYVVVAVTLAVALAVSVGGVAWWASRESGVSAAADDVARVAILPFSVRGDERMGYLSHGLAEILSARLDGLGDLRIVDSNRIIAFSESMESRPLIEQGKAAARQFGARYFVAGSVNAAGERFEVTTTLYDAGGQLLARASTFTSEQELLSAVDELTRRLVGSTVSGVDEHLLRAAAFTAKSIPALKAYLEGERAYREHRMEDMRVSMQRAVAEDSTFALAHYRLAVAAEWAGPPELVRPSLERAARYGGQLTPRHRLLVSGLRAYWEGDFREAHQGYRRTVLLYPEDLEAWYRLAELQFHRMPALGQPFTEARAAFERVLSLDPQNGGAPQHLMRIAAVEGRLADLDSITDRALSLAPPDEGVELRLLRAVAMDDAEGRSLAMTQVQVLPYDMVNVAAVRVVAYSGDVATADGLLAPLTAPTAPAEVRVHVGLQRAEISAAAGRWTEAQSHLGSMAALAPLPALALEASLFILPFAPLDRAQLQQLRERIENAGVAPVGVDTLEGGLLSFPAAAWPALRTFYLGVLSLRLGDESEAAARLEALGRDSIGVRYQLTTTLHMLMAYRAGRYQEGLAASDSLASGDEALAFARHDGLGRYLRGEMLRAVGRDAEAINWLGTFGDLARWDLALLAPAELARAEIAERLGLLPQAAHHYARAISLWQYAADQAPVQAARARLQRLQANTP